MKFRDELEKIRPSKIDDSAYEMLYQIARSKGFEDQLLLNTLIYHMPSDFDLHRFPTRVLMSMCQRMRLNLLITYTFRSVCIFDLDTNRTFGNDFEIAYDKYIGRIELSRSIPLILIHLEDFDTNAQNNDEPNALVYNYFSQQVVMTLPTNQVAMNPSTNFMYEFHNGTIRTYSLRTLEMIETIDASIPPELAAMAAHDQMQLAISPDGYCLTLYATGCVVIHNLILVEKIWQTFKVNAVELVYFIKDFQIMYTTANGPMMLLNLTTGSHDLFFDPTDEVGKYIGSDISVCPGNSTHNLSPLSVLSRSWYQSARKNKYCRTLIIHNGHVTRVPETQSSVMDVYCFSHDGTMLYAIIELEDMEVQLECMTITKVAGGIQLNPTKVPELSVDHGIIDMLNIRCDSTYLHERMEWIFKE